MRQEHRVVYLVRETCIHILQARYPYEEPILLRHNWQFLAVNPLFLAVKM